MIPGSTSGEDGSQPVAAQGQPMAQMPVFVMAPVQQPSAAARDHQSYVKAVDKDGNWMVYPVVEDKKEYHQVQREDGTMEIQEVGGIENALPAELYTTDGIKAELQYEEEVEAEENNFDAGEKFYDTEDKSDKYKFWRFLWCGCLEDYHIITTTYIESSQWEGSRCFGCVLENVSEGRAMDQFTDAYMETSCCEWICNTCCCCGWEDQGTIIINGLTDTAHKDGWYLRDVHNCQETFERLQKIISKNRERSRKMQSGGGKSD